MKNLSKLVFCIIWRGILKGSLVLQASFGRVRRVFLWKGNVGSFGEWERKSCDSRCDWSVYFCRALTWGPSAGLCQFLLFSGRKSPILVPRSFKQHFSGINPCSSMNSKTELWLPLKKWRRGRKEECLCSVKYFHYASDVKKFLVGLKHLWHDSLENKHKTLWCMASSVACFHI